MFYVPAIDSPIYLSPENPAAFEVGAEVGGAGAGALCVTAMADALTDGHALPAATTKGIKRKHVTESEEETVTRVLNEAVHNDMVHLGLEYRMSVEQIDRLPAWIEQNGDGKEVTCLSCSTTHSTRTKRYATLRNTLAAPTALTALTALAALAAPATLS